jgi:YHS domain-containing protein
MLALLWRFLMFIAALWFVQRALALVFGTPKTQACPEAPKTNVADTNRMVRDPVCGMYLDPRLAVALKNKKDTVYFCSQECLRKFDANST